MHRYIYIHIYTYIHHIIQLQPTNSIGVFHLVLPVRKWFIAPNDAWLPLPVVIFQGVGTPATLWLSRGRGAACQTCHAGRVRRG